MAFFFPVIQIAAFFVAIGPVPNDIKLGIVNEELGRYSNCTEYALGNLDRMKGALNENQSCIYEGLGCQYVDLLGDLLKKNQVPTIGSFFKHQVSFSTQILTYKFIFLYFLDILQIKGRSPGSN